MLDWIGKILPKEVKLSINFSPKLTINHIKIDSDNTISQPVVIKKDKLIINESNEVGKSIADKLIKQLPTRVKHNDIVLEDSNFETYKSVDKDLSSREYSKELKEYKKIVPKGDVLILEVAIVVKRHYEDGLNVSVIKSQAVQRFGPRAGMICNLYSSGYFDSLIKPMYDSVQSGSMAMDEYLQMYEMIVTESPLALFVGVGTPASKLKQQLLDKIKVNKAADVGYINIHGIGDQNKKNIINLLEDNDIKSQLVEESTVERTGNAMKVTIYL